LKVRLFSLMVVLPYSSFLLTHPAFPFQGRPDLAAVITGLQQRYAGVQSISAKFQQIYRAPGIEQVESGVLLMRKPGLMRWEYREPEVKLFIADGRNTYLYTPEDRQVLVRALDANELRSTPLRLLLGQGDLARDFEAAWEKEFKPKVEATVLLRLIPRSPESEYAYVVLESDERTFDLRRIVVREPSGNYSEFTLTDVMANVKIDNKQFQFKVPKGVEVIQVDDKE
jgi:outer membrane lipoprotein carrier protein